MKVNLSYRANLTDEISAIFQTARRCPAQWIAELLLRSTVERLFIIQLYSSPSSDPSPSFLQSLLKFTHSQKEITIIRPAVRAKRPFPKSVHILMVWLRRNEIKIERRSHVLRLTLRGIFLYFEFLEILSYCFLLIKNDTNWPRTRHCV